ncbi:MAG: PAS domain S-box protein [Ignavibacteriaceae bacterium]|nr:PAS domain S-box protein [Ignavibacteriaceae bacterium]
MSILQLLKHVIFPGMTIWDSHWITNIFSATLAVIFTWFVLKFQENLNSRLIEEIKSKEKLEKELGEAVSILDAALDSTVDGILVVDRAGKISKFNKQFIDIWEIPISIMETKDDSAVLKYVMDKLESPDIFIAKVQELYDNPLEESYDELYFKDGRKFERYSKPQTVNNDVIGRVWSFREVTEKRKAEEKVKLFEHMVASINESVNIADLDDNLVYVNKAFCNIYGYKENELIGKHSSIFWSDKNDEEVLKQIRPATLKSGWKGELYNKRKDGSVFPIHLSTSVIRDGNNNPVAMVGVARDITERKKEEVKNNVSYKISQAVQSTESLKELFTRIHSVVKDLMPLNNFYIALYDEQTGETTYPYFIDYVDNQTEPRKPAKGCTKYVMRKGKAEIITKMRFVELATDGEMDIRGIPAAVWLGIPLKVFNNTIGVMVVQDYIDEKAYGDTEKEILTIVSEQIASAIYKKRTEYQLMAFAVELQSINELLSESEKNLKEMNASKDKFFSIISHDLKAPYQGLLSMLDLLIREYDNLNDEEKKEIFLKIRNNSQRTYNLLDNLLQWSRMQTGKMRYEPARINLLNVLSGIIDLYCETASIKKINIKYTIDENIHLFADLNMVQLIMRNLLSNAIKFSNPDSEILVTAGENDGKIEISVRDNGIGISKLKAENLFKIDVQSSTMGTARETGTGLGLLLCKDMINLHKGNIRVESKEGVGSTFTFTIPSG